MIDLLLAAVLVGAALGYVAIALRVERRRRRRRGDLVFLAQVADTMRRGRRRRPKVDNRIQRRRYAR